MSRFSRGLRRTVQVLALATPVVALTVGIWYQRHYVLPTYDEDAVKRAVP